MDFGALVPLVAYVLAIQLTMRANAHPLLSSSVAVLIPYVVTITVGYIIDPINPLKLFSFASLVAVFVNFLICMYVFKKIRDSESIVAIVAWGAAGFIFTIYAIPYFIGLVGI